jgi:hypothetical protein
MVSCTPEALSPSLLSFQGIIELGTKLDHRSDAPWGLARISGGSLAGQNDLYGCIGSFLTPTYSLWIRYCSALNFTFKYDSSAGSGVDVYVIGL